MDDARTRMTPKLLDSLYVEAMVLADEARAYFDREGREQRQLMDPLVRVAFSCESLKVTTRLMHILAWLLAHRSREAGHVEEGLTQLPQRLGEAPESDPGLVASLPEAAAQIIESSTDLYARIRRLDEGGLAEPKPSPARSLMGLLERSF